MPHEPRSWSDDVEPLDGQGKNQRPPTEIAVKLEQLGWTSLFTVPDRATDVPSEYRLECDKDLLDTDGRLVLDRDGKTPVKCRGARRLIPMGRREAYAVPADWGPPHVCRVVPVAEGVSA